MSLKVGIVGLPNVGKSTLFNALLKRAQAQAENRPFTTIEPNVGIIDVPDERLSRLHEIIVGDRAQVKGDRQHQSPKSHHPSASTQEPRANTHELSPKIVPATIEFVDIAGLVRGAHRGEGLGNQFLSHIREVDTIIHVVRFFEDENVIHIENNVNPRNDFETINIELILADLQTISKLIIGCQSDAKSGNATIAKLASIRLSALKKIEQALQNEKPAREAELDSSEQKAIEHENLMTLKPMIVVANVSEAQLIEADDLADRFLPEVEVLGLCAKIEAELADLSEQDANDYLADIGQSEPGLNKLITCAYETLGLQTFFTAGPIEVKAWTVKVGATAPQAAGVIHTDFQKGFIKAEVISFEDFIKYNGEQKAKESGRLRIEGKDYIVANGDICHFRFNV